MQIAAITGQGLRWITVLVFVLWVCVLVEDAMVKHARHETAMALVALRQLREGRQPVRATQPLRLPDSIVKPAIS